MAEQWKVEWFCRQAESQRQRMYALAVGILRNEADAQDAVQNALLNAYAHLSQLRLTQRVKPWLMTIVTRECYRILQQRHPQADVEQLSNMQSGSMDADVRLSLWDAVMTLDVSYRTVILLFYYEDMSIRQIAKTLTLSEDTVKKRLSRAREKLRTSLEKEDFE